MTQWADEEILNALRTAARTSSRPLAQAAYREWRRGNPGPDDGVIRQRLGNWPTALAAAGLAQPLRSGSFPWA